jgi:hypothetical protein
MPTAQILKFASMLTHRTVNDSPNNQAPYFTAYTGKTHTPKISQQYSTNLPLVPPGQRHGGKAPQF